MNKLLEIENLCKRANGENRLEPPIFKGLVCRGDFLGNGNGCKNCERCDWYRENPLGELMDKYKLIKKIREILNNPE